MYQNAPSKAVVGVDRPMIALYIHIYNIIKARFGKIVQVLIAVIMSKNIFLTKFLHAYV